MQLPGSYQQQFIFSHASRNDVDKYMKRLKRYHVFGCVDYKYLREAVSSILYSVPEPMEWCPCVLGLAWERRLYLNILAEAVRPLTRQRLDYDTNGLLPTGTYHVVYA